MGLLDKLPLDKLPIDKAKDLYEKSVPKIAGSVDKATDAIDKRTGGRFTDQLKKVDAAAGKLAGKDGATAAAADDATAEPADQADQVGSADDDAS